MKLLIVRRDVWTILAVCEEERCPLYRDLEALGKRLPGDFAKIMRRFEHFAANGPPRNKELCRELEDGIFELKAQKGLMRVFFFYDEGRVVVCSHAVQKPKKKTLRTQISRARRARKAYLAEKSRDRLVIVKEVP